MKNILTTFFLLCTMFCKAQQSGVVIFESSKKHSFSPFTVYQIGSEHCDTIIRNKPNGKVNITLDKENYYSFEIVRIKGEWFKVINVIPVDNSDFKIPRKKGWVHNSDIGVATRKNVELLSEPMSGNIVGTIEQETNVEIVDAYVDWVKIEFEGLTGWVQSEWLCGNPVTTCP